MKLFKKIWQWIKDIVNNIFRHREFNLLWREYNTLIERLHTFQNQYNRSMDKRISPGPKLRKEISSLEKRIKEVRKEMSDYYDS